MAKAPKKNVCSFCGRSMPHMFSGMEDGTLICSECVEMGHQLVLKIPKSTSSDELNLDNLPKPQEIKDFLDMYVIGQDDA
ncbi:MAG: ATP-dependent Clp protease ATP-binding subunit ClpX, partial [Paludibacteraceae bacterium]|nr:ATP-dependent Clp protease ATP-binding subunit ClpX [Paludibacteraceae bacterium]